MSDINVGSLVDDYMHLRMEYEELKHEFEADEARLKLSMDYLKQQLLAQCNSLGVDSLKTEHGTVIRQLKERYYTQDWEGFHRFVIENRLPQLLEKRIAQGNMKEYLTEHAQEDGLPPGVNVLREFEITVRKPVQRS
jgi:hypothetical protein